MEIWPARPLASLLYPRLTVCFTLITPVGLNPVFLLPPRFPGCVARARDIDSFGKSLNGMGSGYLTVTGLGQASCVRARGFIKLFDEFAAPILAAVGGRGRTATAKDAGFKYVCGL